jgi:dienelactone hydrolase
MTLYALIPYGATARFPAVMCPHGHGSAGKYSPAGRRDIPQVAEAINVYNYDYGVQFAKAGFIAFCPDARGFGERQEESAVKYLHPGAGIMAHSCQYINQMAYPLGQTVTGMWAWDLHRLIDYIQTRKDVVPGRIGCAGLSGGGLQTMWATALDEEQRIKAAVISGYFYGYRESLLEQHHNCSCNYVPHLYETADMGDIGALIAPRPLLIETGDADPLNGRSLRNVTSQVAITKKAYKLLGAGDRLRHHVFPGGHKWHGGEAVPWMQKWVGGE